MIGQLTSGFICWCVARRDREKRGAVGNEKHGCQIHVGEKDPGCYEGSPTMDSPRA